MQLRFRKVIWQTEWIILCLALIFFFWSLVIDVFPFLNHRPTLNYLLEDGLKLLGIASWLSYFAIVSFQITKNCLNSEQKISSVLSKRNF